MLVFVKVQSPFYCRNYYSLSDWIYLLSSLWLLDFSTVEFYNCFFLTNTKHCSSTVEKKEEFLTLLTFNQFN